MFISRNKHVEKALYNEVKERFGLLELHKDDSITPALMILCCQRLLTRVDKIGMVSMPHNLLILIIIVIVVYS